MPLEGHLLGYYKLQHLIGSGGMGEIYVAEDTHMPRKVAVKIIRTEKSPSIDNPDTQETERLFQREMQAISLLDHPHILPIFDYGTDQANGVDLTYMVMPYRAEGSLLDQLTKRGNTPLAPPEVAHILLQAADALQHAHERQIVHQDIKPSNFLMRIRNSEAYLPDILLADFGIAKFLNANTSTQNVRGTPTYMSPEQWEGRPVFASDQYSLGIMAFQLLTGQPPFRGAAGQIMHQHFNMQPSAPSMLNPRLSPAIDAVLFRALAKRPEERFPSVFQFAQAFQRALSQESAGQIGQSQLLQGNGHAPLMAGERPFSVIATSSPQQSSTLISGSSYSQGTHASSLSGQQGASSPGFSAGEFAMAGNMQATPSNHKVQPRSRFSTFQKVIFLSVAIVLVILGSGGLLLAHNINSSSGSLAKTSTKGSLPVRRATTRPVTTVVVPTQKNATPQSSNPYFSGNNKLLLSDPLSVPKTSWKNSYATSWGGTCVFENKEFHIVQHLGPNRSYTCDAGTKLQSSNFAYEAQMTILQGTCGGITFRYNSTTHRGYSLQVCADGSVALIDNSGTASAGISFESIAPAVHRGLNQHNILAAVAKAHGIDFYVNDQKIGRVTAATMTENMFALFAIDNSAPTEVAFRDVKIWKL